jgi:hypothetical protein
MSRPYNYTKRTAQSTDSTNLSGSNATAHGVGVSKSPQMPDRIIHHPPIAMYVIGGGGVLLGVATNFFQMFTTFIAFWGILNPSGTPVDLGKQPMDFAICAFIAVSFQFSLIVLTFRIDSTWKRKNASIATGVKGNAIKSTAIEIVQHVNLVTIWGLLGFVVDTIGDYTFVSIYTTKLDPYNAIFIVFLYAVALYSLSTIACVRSIEFLWAGFRAADNIGREK